MEKNGALAQGFEDPADHLAVGQRLAAGQAEECVPCGRSIRGGGHGLRHVAGVDWLATPGAWPDDRENPETPHEICDRADVGVASGIVDQGRAEDRPGDPPGLAEPLHFLFGAPQPLRQIPLVRIEAFRLEEHAGRTEGDQPVSAVDVRDESRQCGDRSEGEQDRGGGNPQAFLAGHTAPGKARRGFVWNRFRTSAETQPLKPSAGQALREMATD